MMRLGGVFAGLAASAMLFAPISSAASAYLNGLGNVGPGWSTITMPDGSRCAQGCTEVKWNYWSTGGVNGSTAAALRWMTENNNPQAVLYGYSLGAVGVNDARALLPDWQGTVIELGSPARPFNGASVRDSGRPLLQVGGGRIEYLSVMGDEAAVRQKRLFGTHTSGYRNRDFSKETPVIVNEYGDNVIDRVYADPPQRFRLFDMSTWTVKRTTTSPALGRAVPDDPSPVEARPGRPTTAAERPSAAERRAERKAARTEHREARAERRAERRSGDGSA